MGTAQQLDGNMKTRRVHTLLFVILAVQIVLGVGWMAVTPLWQGHETDFFTVLRFLDQNGLLPAVEDYPPGKADLGQVTQPPFYYLTAAPVVAAFDSGAALNAGLNPVPLCIGGDTTSSLARLTLPTSEEGFPPHGAAAAGYGLRLLNLALGVAAVVFAFATGRVLFPARPAIALIGAALLAFEPSTIRMITFISNDTLLLTIAASNLYCAARLITSRPLCWRWAVALFVLAALAVLTRLTGWAVLALDVLVLLGLAVQLVWRGLVRRGGRRQALIAIGVVGALAAGVVAIGAFNLSTSGSVFGRYSFLDERVGRALSRFELSPLLVTTVLDRTRLAFLEPLDTFAPHRLIALAYVLAPLVALAGALVGLIMAAVQRVRSRPAAALAALLLLWAALLTAAGLVLFRNVVDVAAYGGITEYNSAGAFAPIRYYAPGLPPAMLLIAFGALALMDWTAALVRRASVRVGEGIARAAWLPGAALAVLWGAVMLLGIIAAAQATPRVLAYLEGQARALAGVTWPDNAASAGRFPRILGYSTASGAQPGMTAITLYAVADSPGPSALGRVLTTGADGNMQRCEFVPGQGTHPIPLWEPATVYALTVNVPQCADAPGDWLDLAFQWAEADASGNLTGTESPTISLGSVSAPAARAAGCVDSLGQIAGYRVVRFTGPETAGPGETVLPSLNWIVEEPSSEVVSRVYTFTHADSGTTYTCTRMDGGLDQWTRGSYRYFDRCVFAFPEDAPRGQYVITVSLQDAQGHPLPATRATGEPIENGQVPIGQITVE